MVESAIKKPLQTFDGKDLYESNIDKIVTVTYSLISNHAFIDGNKRIGVAVMIYLLRLNNISIDYTQKDLIELVLGVASGKLVEQDIAKWITIRNT